MGKINVLGFEIANLIAAGEVVDRPASVLKELVENAIDAGANQVTVQIRSGGILSIRVADNGCGMTPEDLPVAIRRHATSKIHAADDLNRIMTLGFRGEALAAIAAVSELTIVTKTHDAENGTMLVSDGGTVTDLTEVGAADGTTVLVEHLFGKVPARRKFLKKDRTEAQACAAQMEKVAMSHPEIAFRFLSDDVLKFSTAGDGDVKNVLWALYGRDFAAKLLAVSGESDGVLVSGYVGRSDNAYGNRNMQNVFINGRYVKSKTVTAALERAFTSYMAPEKYPVSALYLEIDPSQVDVNVHPAKLEVRFSDERRIFDAVYWAVRTALEQNTDRPAFSLGDPYKTARAVDAFAPIGAKLGGEQISMPPPLARPSGAGAVHTPGAPATATAPAPAAPAHTPTSGASGARSASTAAAPPPREELTPAESLAFLETLRAGTAEVREGTLSEPFAPATSNGAMPGFSASARTEVPPAAAPVAPEEPASAERTAATAKTSATTEETSAETDSAAVPPYRYLGCAFKCYLIVEVGDGLLLIDQHAAHERILFEQLLAAQKSEGGIPTQGLLIPLTVSLTPEELAAAEDAAGELKEIGFAFSPTADGKGVALLTLPNAVSPGEAVDLFTRMAGDLVSASGTPGMTNEKRRERALYQVACKAAIKGGRTYTEEQLTHLIEQVLSLPDVTVCPHGRPIAYRLSKHELDRRFDRIK